MLYLLCKIFHCWYVVKFKFLDKDVIICSLSRLLLENLRTSIISRLNCRYGNELEILMLLIHSLGCQTFNCHFCGIAHFSASSREYSGFREFESNCEKEEWRKRNPCIYLTTISYYIIAKTESLFYKIFYTCCIFTDILDEWWTYGTKFAFWWIGIIKSKKTRT